MESFGTCEVERGSTGDDARAYIGLRRIRADCGQEGFRCLSFPATGEQNSLQQVPIVGDVPFRGFWRSAVSVSKSAGVNPAFNTFVTKLNLFSLWGLTLFASGCYSRRVPFWTRVRFLETSDRWDCSGPSARAGSTQPKTHASCPLNQFPHPSRTREYTREAINLARRQHSPQPRCIHLDFD